MKIKDIHNLNQQQQQQQQQLENNNQFNMYKKLNNGLSLNDLNSHLLNPKSLPTDCTKNNNNNNSSKQQSGEHKLLNGLLSKPLANENSGQNNNNNNNKIDNLIKHNKLNQFNSNNTKQFNMLNNNSSQSQQLKCFMNEDFNALPPNMVCNKQISPKSPPPSVSQPTTTSPSHLLYYNLLNQQHQDKLKLSSSNIELNMLELILNEIEMCVENKESSERIRQMIIQMHIYFNEKINDLQSSKNKLLAEFDEYKMGLQTENEQLRCQLKLLQIQSEFSKDNYLIRKNNNNTNTVASPSTNQMKQHQGQTSPPTPAKPISSPNNNLLSASQHIQNMLLLQQQQQQQKHHHQFSNNLKNQSQQDIQSIAAQSFPHFFLNHYQSSQQIPSQNGINNTNNINSTKPSNSSSNQQSLEQLAVAAAAAAAAAASASPIKNNNSKLAYQLPHNIDISSFTAAALAAAAASNNNNSSGTPNKQIQNNTPSTTTAF
jgi:hypothetical protein